MNHDLKVICFLFLYDTNRSLSWKKDLLGIREQKALSRLCPTGFLTVDHVDISEALEMNGPDVTQ